MCLTKQKIKKLKLIINFFLQTFFHLKTKKIKVDDFHLKSIKILKNKNIYKKYIIGYDLPM